MIRRQHMHWRRGMSEVINIRVQQAETIENGVLPGCCVGEHRLSGGSQNGSKWEAALLDVAGGLLKPYDTSNTMLVPGQFSWLSCENLVVLLQSMVCDIEEVFMYISNQVYKTGKFDEESIREFFKKDYMQCIKLVSELESRLNNI